MKHAVEIANQTFFNWRKVAIEVRLELVKNLIILLKKNKDFYASLITEEMKKPISQSVAEVEKCAWLCEYYIGNAPQFLENKIVKTNAIESYVTYEPLGVILGVMPWNFPFWQVFRFAIPTLIAGNTVIVKHASNVGKTANLLQQIFEEAQFPKGCYMNVAVKGSEVHQLIAMPEIKAVSLTGSENAGISVATVAGKYLKKCVLELGGNNAFIVLQDAAIDKIIAIAVNARMQNAGQSCIAAKRYLLHQKIADEFTEKYINAINKLVVGNPFDVTTQIGPLARLDLAIDLEIQVRKSIEMGAKLLLGGKRIEDFFEPTVLTNVTPEMPIFKEETFGPVVAITTFSDIDEAIKLSNQSEFGLGVSIFTSNPNAIKKYIPKFEEGAVFINEMVKSDPRMPFGGVKKSGYGRELAENGIKEFVNVKTVMIY